MIFRCRIFSILLAVFGLTACDAPPELSVPLGDPGEPFDKRLEGNWVEDSGWKSDTRDRDRRMAAYAQIIAKTYYLKNSRAVDAARTGSVLEAMFLMNAKRGFLWRLEAFPTVINGKAFYNVRRLRTYPQWDYTTAGGRAGTIVIRPVLLNDDVLAICGFLWPWGNHGKSWLKRSLKKLGLRAQMVEDERTGLTHTFVEVGRDVLRTILRRPDTAQYFVLTLIFRRYGADNVPKGQALANFAAQEIAGDCIVPKPGH